MPNKPRTIDIGEKAPEELQNVLGYYAPLRRTTESGLVFMTYYGLRQYLVTGGFDERLLSLEDRMEIQEISRGHKWNHVGELRIRLMAALLHNVRLNHSIVSGIMPEDCLKWARSTPKLSDQERVWLDIVRSVIGCK